VAIYKSKRDSINQTMAGAQKKRTNLGGKTGKDAGKRSREDDLSAAGESTTSSKIESLLQPTRTSGQDRVPSTTSKVPFSIRSGKPDGNSVPAMVAVVPEREQQSITGSETPSAEWYDQIRKKSLRSKDSMFTMDLIAYVRTDLFPKLKFIMDQRQMVFSYDKKTICQQIMADMGVKECLKSGWWECYKNKILKTLNSKRADVTSAIKRRFVSKCNTGR
jgi:hypothetical protein